MNYNDFHVIEGGEEKYGQDGNWGILAFPGKLYGVPGGTDGTIKGQNFDLDNIEDYNSLDKFRFLYLWRTYIDDFNGVTYKIRLY